MAEAGAQALKPLVTTGELAQNPDWRIFDCRHDLGRPDWGREEYEKSHIPQARFAHLDRDLSAPMTGRNGRHPLPEMQDFVRFLERSGILPTDPIVCYDAGSGAYAARLWWMLRWAGHAQAAVLDGGLAKWVAEGRPVTAEAPLITGTKYKGKPERSRMVALATVERQLKRLALLDARAPARYRGEQEPIDPVAGRIPGALNRFNGENVTAEGVFKSPEVLRAEFEKAISGKDPKNIVHYCGSGVAACHNALAMEIAGLSGSRVYIGSWSEWSADPSRPISRSV
jgi:thiosulfate/3-mercaptopyruvate sulfurtransferase